MVDFSDLTLIIASYGNRHHFVIRTCTYWKGSGAKIIIADGSIDKMPEAYQKQLPETTTYVHRPSEDYFIRLREATQLVDTKYVIMHPDDDIMFRSVVGKCIDELNNDPELMACDGIYSWFSYFKNTLFSLKGFSIVKSLPPLSNDSKERLHQSFDSVFLYGVWTSKMLKTCFKMLPQKVSSPAVFCMVFQWGLAYLGKWKTLRELMWFRSYEEQPSSERDGIKRSFYFHQWYEGEAYNSEVAETFDLMGKTISAETGESVESITKNLAEVFDINSDLSKKEFGADTPKISLKESIRLYLRNHIPRSLINKYRSYVYKDTPPAGVVLDEQVSWLNENGIYVDESNIEDVKVLVQNYHEGIYY